MSGKQKTEATSLRAHYEKLLASKQAERELAEYKDVILSALADGISDEELVRLIKKSLPAIKLTPKRLAQLRATWSLEAAADTASTETQTINPKVVFPQHRGGA